MSNREALLEAALRCLQERGYARTTARDLVLASGTNLGAIGYHFGSKERLLSEALAEGCRRWFLEIVAAASIDAKPSPGEWLPRLAEEIPRSFQRNRALAVAFVEGMAQSQRMPEIRKQLAGHYEETRRALIEMIERTMAEELPSPDARAVASLMIAAFDGLLVQWLLDPRRTPSGVQVLDALERAAEPLQRARAEVIR